MKEFNSRSVTELIAAGSIVISLIFVGMELRENSAIATYDAFKDYSSDVAVAQALFGSSNVRFWPRLCENSEQKNNRLTRVLCFIFCSTLLNYNCTLMRVFSGLRLSKIVFPRPGPKADPFKAEIQRILAASPAHG